MKNKRNSALSLDERFRYDSLTGDVWQRIGGGCGRYHTIHVDGRDYLKHRFIWRLKTGKWPARNKHVHHRDDDKGNNAWDNLELVTPSQNEAAKRGVRGAHRQPNGRWKAVLGTKHLGYFSTEKEAVSAYRSAHVTRYGEHSPYFKV